MSAASTALLGLPCGAARAAAPLPHLSPSEPLAKSLGYVNDASQENPAKFPTYKPGETCDKCHFYQGKGGQAWGPCQIFVGKDVNARGWCASFMAKK